MPPIDDMQNFWGIDLFSDLFYEFYHGKSPWDHHVGHILYKHFEQI